MDQMEWSGVAPRLLDQNKQEVNLAVGNGSRSESSTMNTTGSMQVRQGKVSTYKLFRL